MYLIIAFEHLVGLDCEFFNLRVEEWSRIDSNYSWFNCFASAPLIFVLCLRWTFSQCYSIAYCSSTAFISMRTESINPHHTAFSVWKCLPLSKQSTSINGAETLNGYVWRSQFRRCDLMRVWRSHKIGYLQLESAVIIKILKYYKIKFIPTSESNNQNCYKVLKSYIIKLESNTSKDFSILVGCSSSSPSKHCWTIEACLFDANLTFKVLW